MTPLVLPIAGLILVVAQIIYGDTPQSQGYAPHLNCGGYSRQLRLTHKPLAHAVQTDGAGKSPCGTRLLSADPP